MKTNSLQPFCHLKKVVVAGVALLALQIVGFTLADVVEKPKAWDKEVPENKADLLAIQAKLQAVLSKSKTAVVAVQSGGGAGSGVIVSKDGLVLTAGHVSGRPGRNVTIVLPDGRKVTAVTMGGSEISDSGMCKIKEEGEWPFVPMAGKGETKVGDWCFALGHPGGFMEKRGIVTRIGRVINKRDATLRTDCRLLGGDSGGPLFNLDGEVIGIHSRIAMADDANFHAPIESYIEHWDLFKEGKKISRKDLQKGGFLGVGSEETDEGLKILRVVRGSAADKGGILVNDVITAIDGEPIDSREELSIVVGSKAAGDEVVVDLLRGDKELTISLELGKRPE
ncbi:MAG: trypsin-like peptidase domain-containing protein [Opitutales bacterium]